MTRSILWSNRNVVKCYDSNCGIEMTLVLVPLQLQIFQKSLAKAEQCSQHNQAIVILRGGVDVNPVSSCCHT